MQVTPSDSIQLSPWAEGDHAPLTTDARGPLPALDQPANTWPRVPRIPASARHAAPPPRDMHIVELYRRLHRNLSARYLRWQLRHMRARLDQIEVQMNEATDTAVGLALLHRHSSALQAHRRALRLEHEAQAAEWLNVRRELDALEARP